MSDGGKIMEDFEKIKVTLRFGGDNFPMTFEDWLDINCKMSPIKHMETRYDRNIETKKYLSDFLSGEINWGKELRLHNHDAYHPVFISAPTGAGKNYYLVHNILGSLLDKNMQSKDREQILLFSNRVALGRQTKLDIAKFICEWTGDNRYEKSINTRTDEGLDEVHDFGDIIMYSYQQVVDANIDFSEYNIRYVIFDECHFFTSDAAFNPSTGSILETLMDKFYNVTRLYMSSTMETAFEPIIRSEVAHYRKTNYASDRADKRLFFSYYNMSRHYDYLKFKSWKTNQDIISEIQKNEDKWLIFVSNKNSGNILKKSIKTLIPNIEVEFITAESKETSIYKEIIKNEKLPSNIRVLITTAVIDNGVNIKDEKVRNIVIDVPDRVEFIQMLGRIRINKEKELNHINLYLRDFDLENLKKSWRNNAKELELRWNYEINGVIPREKKSQFFEITEAHINPLSKYQILAQMDDLRRMILAIDPDATLVLNGSEHDLQVRMFNFYYNKDTDILGRRICNALRDVKKGHLQEGEIKQGMEVHAYPVLKEKSFLQLIQEKRASSLEHDAVNFIEKNTKYNYDEYREECIKGINMYDVPSLEQEINSLKKLDYAVNPRQYQMDQWGYENAWKDSLKAYPPDKLVDLAWADFKLWDKLKLAYNQYSFDNPEEAQPIPYPDYMKEQCELYRSLANNDIGSESPVLMEQLHWLDIDNLDIIEDMDEYNVIEEKNTVEDTMGEDLFSDEDVCALLDKNAYLYEDVKDKLEFKEKNREWILKHGYSSVVLKNIKRSNLYNNDIDKQYKRENNHRMMQREKLLRLLSYFNKFYKIKENDDFTFKKLQNKLKKNPYKFHLNKKKYEFTIRNIDTREYGEKATYYIFIKEEIQE